MAPNEEQLRQATEFTVRAAHNSGMTVEEIVAASESGLTADRVEEILRATPAPPAPAEPGRSASLARR